MFKKTLSIIVSFIIFFTVFIVDVPTYSAPVMAGLSMGEFLFGSTYASLMSGMLDTFDGAEDPSFDEVLGALTESEYDVDGTKLKSCVSVSDLVKIGFTYEKAKKAEELYNKYKEMNVYYLGLADKLAIDAELEEIAEKQEELRRQSEQAKRDAEYAAYRTMQSNYNDAVDVIKSGIQAIGGVKVNFNYVDKVKFSIGGTELGSILDSNFDSYFKNATGSHFGYTYRFYPDDVLYNEQILSNDLGSFISAIKNVSSDFTNDLKVVVVNAKRNVDGTYCDPDSTIANSMIHSYIYSQNGDPATATFGRFEMTPIFLYSQGDISVSADKTHSKNSAGYLQFQSSSPIFYLLPAYDYANPTKYKYYRSSTHVGVANDGLLYFGLTQHAFDNVTDRVVTGDISLSVPDISAKIAILPFVLPLDLVNTAVGIDDFISDKEKIYAPIISGDIPIDGDIVDVPIDDTIPGDDKDGISFPSILDVNLTKVGGIELDKATQFNFSSVTALGKEFTNKFPFCLPWDLFYLVNKFNQPPSDPIFEIDMSYFTLKEFKSDVEGIKFRIDLTDYDYIIKMLRFFILAIFVFGLISNTGKLIKH